MKQVDWEKVAAKYRKLYEVAIGADCKPEDAMTVAGANAIRATHANLDGIVEFHTASNEEEDL